MLSPTFGRSWKLQIAFSLKQCIASLKFVMAGPNALPKYLRDTSWYLPFKFFLRVGWANRLFEAFVRVLIASQEDNQILVNEIWNYF